MKPKQAGILLLILLGLLGVGLSVAEGQGTAFNYQGQLQANSLPANGLYDFQFSLSNAPSGGSQIGSTLTRSGVGVTNGLFTTTLDFGGVFQGNATWLAISVRSNGSGANFTALSPLQELSPTPYAIYAPNAGVATVANTASSVAATNISGTIAPAQLSAGTANINISGNAATATSAVTAGFATSAASLSGINFSSPLSNFTGLNIMGDSMMKGCGSQTPMTPLVSITVAGFGQQVGNALGLPVNDYAISGQPTVDFQWQQVMVKTWNSPSIQLYGGTANDFFVSVSPNSPTANTNAYVAAAQMGLANLAYLCFQSADAHPVGTDVLPGNNHYGYTNANSSWAKAGAPSGSGPLVYFWQPIGENGGLLSTNRGDTITLTNIVGPSFVLLHDKWSSITQPTVGGTMSVYIDNGLVTNINCNVGGYEIYNSIGPQWSNICTAAIFSGLANARHTVVISNAGGNIAFDAVLAPQMMTATNPVYYMDLWQEPAFVHGPQVVAYDLAFSNDCAALDAIGLPVTFMDCSAVLTSNLLNPYDLIHPNFYGHLALTQIMLNAMTGSPAFGTAYLLSGNVIDPYGPNYQNLLSDGNGQFANNWTGSNTWSGSSTFQGPILIQSLPLSPPAAVAGYGIPWNSNGALYWITTTHTNYISGP